MASSSRKRAIQIILIILVVLVVAIGLTIFLRNKPASVATKRSDGQETIVKAPKDRGKIKYRILHEQMENSVTSEAIKALSLQNIAFDVEKSGRFFNLSVDRDYYEAAKNLLALKGIPSRGASGFELLDEDQGFGVTEYDKRIRFNRALSGELAKMISQFYDVQDSQVRVVVPEKSSWSTDVSQVTASVLVRGVDGRIVSDETVFSIMKLLQTAVSDLTLANISVVDINSEVLSIGVQERLAQKARNQVRNQSDNMPVAETPDLTPPDVPEPEPEQVAISPVKPEIKPDSLSTVKADLIQSRMRNMTDVLTGILPDNSYNSAIDLELKEDFTVSQMTISIIVDSSQIPILDQPLKKQIFRVVSGATGYNRARGDRIKLDLAQLDLQSAASVVADLAPDTSLDESRSPEIVDRRDQNAPAPSILWPYALIPVGGIGITMVWLYRRNRRKKQAAQAAIDLADDSATADQDDTIIATKLQQLAVQSPAAMGQVIQQWLEPEFNNE